MYHVLHCFLLMRIFCTSILGYICTTVYTCLYFVFFILPVMIFNYRLQCWSLLTIKHFDEFLEEKYYHVFFDSDY